MSDTGKIVALVKALAPVADQETVDSAVETYLDNHPEATTTVQDGSITEAKLASALAQKVNQVTSLSDEIDGIDSDVTDLKSAITSQSEDIAKVLDIISVNAYPFYQGWVRNDGTLGDASKTCRTQNFLKLPNNAVITAKSGYEIRLNEYSGNTVSTFVKRLSSGFASGTNTFATDSGKNYIIEIQNTDGTTLAVANVPEDAITYQKKTTHKNVICATDYGAIGDGVALNSYALQTAIDVGFANGSPVFIPKGTYLITTPLKVYGVPDFDSSGSIILGAGVGNTIIKKNDRTSYTNSLNNSSVSVFAIEASETPVENAQHNFKISDMTIDGNTYADFGIFSTLPVASFEVSNLNIESGRRMGIYFCGNTYLGKISSVRVYSFTEIGICIYGGTNTSLNLQNCYVISCAIGYQVMGMYCTLINCCAEVISDTVFKLINFFGTLSNPGSEANTASIMFYISGSTVSINGSFTFGNASAGTSHFKITGSKVTCIGSNIMYTTQTLNGHLCELSSTAILNLLGCKVATYAEENVIESGSTLNVM